MRCAVPGCPNDATWPDDLAEPQLCNADLILFEGSPYSRRWKARGDLASDVALVTWVRDYAAERRIADARRREEAERAKAAEKKAKEEAAAKGDDE